MTPRLSPSIAKVLLSCPAKAWLAHRQLGGVESEPTPAMLEGQLFERLITGHGVDEIEIVPFDSWRKKDAQAVRDAAIAAGRVPVLEHQYSDVLGTAEKIRGKILDRIPSFSAAANQVRLEWESAGCACSGVLDKLLVDDGAFRILDLKKVADASPDYIQHSVMRFGHDVQQAAYIEAVTTTYPETEGRGEMFFVCYEIHPPYCVTVARLAGDLVHNGRKRWDRAKRIWRACLEANDWPEYATETITIDAKPWMLDDGEDADDFGGL